MKKITRIISGIVIILGLPLLVSNYNTKGFDDLNLYAFSDGTCCPEGFSICGLNGQNYEDKYLKPGGGSCFGESD